MPRALAVTWDLVRSDIEDDVKKATLLRFDEVFGLDIAEWSPPVVEIPEQIIALAAERTRINVLVGHDDSFPFAQATPVFSSSLASGRRCHARDDGRYRQ